MNEERLRVLVIGAHPDDPDFSCGGTAALWAAAGHEVRFLSTTSGDTGHHAIGGIELARRRQAEASRSAAVAGVAEYRILDNHTGELEPTVANRRMLIRLIRELAPDLVLSHRPNDYHPDHRATGQLVMDASYILTVPNMVALTAILPRPPVILSLEDSFTRPCPFQADVVVGIDGVIERKLDMLHCHVSQVYECSARNQGVLDQAGGDADRRGGWRMLPWAVRDRRTGGKPSSYGGDGAWRSVWSFEFRVRAQDEKPSGRFPFFATTADLFGGGSAEAATVPPARTAPPSRVAHGK
jgi:LmbE family N-acetylglucosaminyl deacetylase